MKNIKSQNQNTYCEYSKEEIIQYTQIKFIDKGNQLGEGKKFKELDKNLEDLKKIIKESDPFKKICGQIESFKSNSGKEDFIEKGISKLITENQISEGVCNKNW